MLTIGLSSFLALMFPDTSDVVFPFQTEVYWCHHVLLVATPFILFFTKKYHVERVSHLWYGETAAPPPPLADASCPQVRLGHPDRHLVLLRYRPPGPRFPALPG